MSRRREICGLEVVKAAGVPGPHCLEVELCLRERATGFQGQTISAVSVILLFHFQVVISGPEGVAGRSFQDAGDLSKLADELPEFRTSTSLIRAGVSSLQFQLTQDGPSRFPSITCFPPHDSTLHCPRPHRLPAQLSDLRVLQRAQPPTSTPCVIRPFST